MSNELKQNEFIDVVDKQLKAYNDQDFEAFASCYHAEITCYSFEDGLPIPQMSGPHFFSHYKEKFAQNPEIFCEVTARIAHDNCVVDQELISGYEGCRHTEMVVYQVEQKLITKMWFSKEIPGD